MGDFVMDGLEEMMKKLVVQHYEDNQWASFW